MNPDRPESSSADDSRHETSGGEASGHTEGSGSQDVTMSEAEVSSHVDHIKRLFVERTENYGIPLLERLYTRIMKGIFETKDKGIEDDGPTYSILSILLQGGLSGIFSEADISRIGFEFQQKDRCDSRNKKKNRWEGAKPSIDTYVGLSKTEALIGSFLVVFPSESSKLLKLGGGYLFGLPVGFVADSIGAAGAAFLLGRTIGRSFVVSKLKDYPKFSSVAIAIQKSGFKPITLALVYIGTTLKDLSDVTHGWSEFSTTRWVLIVLGLVVSDNIPDLARKPPSSLSRASAQIHTVYSPFQMQIVVQKMRDSRVPWVLPAGKA
ncbi:hypothetical protein D5086_030162 [Populus alba]|uniref:Uncharacterized protein n=1 Tax=Populus alba TaxID=43335 RepID=A0ACC4ANC4_POPAL